jgi:rubredoxin
MPWWKCDTCGYTFQEELPPQDSKCPQCQAECTFKNVTCYVPECGGAEGEHIDHRL